MLKVFIEQHHSQLSWNQLCSKVTHCWEREKKTSWAVYRIRLPQVTHSLLAPRLPPTAGGRNTSRRLIFWLWWPWNRPMMVPAAPVKRICCTETSWNGAPVPLNTSDHQKESSSSRQRSTKWWTRDLCDKKTIFDPWRWWARRVKTAGASDGAFKASRLFPDAPHARRESKIKVRLGVKYCSCVFI